jgi:hypothetical protein
MRTLSPPYSPATDQLANRRDGSPRRSSRTSRRRPHVESLECRSLCSVGGPEAAVPAAHHHVEVRHFLTVADHVGARPVTPAFQVQAARKKQRSFTLTQEEKFLQGKWVVIYDASNLFGPGAVGAQEIVLTGKKTAGQFSSISGVSVVGFFGLRSYYQFGSWGTYRFLNKKLVRLTITGASPTEYLNSGIIVMDGQSMPIQFVNKNQFVVDGQVYNREALNQTIFNQ